MVSSTIVTIGQHLQFPLLAVDLLLLGLQAALLLFRLLTQLRDLARDSVEGELGVNLRTFEVRNPGLER